VKIRTTGARIASILAAYAAVALLGSGGAHLASRPIAEAQVREAITGEESALEPLAAHLSQAAFAALVADRGILGAAAGIHYGLRSPTGATLAGRLPDSVWSLRLADRFGGFDLPPVGGGPVRHMLGRERRFQDGTRLMIAHDVDARVDAALRLLWPVTLAIVLTALAGVAAALVFARRGELQLRDASVVVGRILAGDLSQRLPPRAGTGFSTLAREINVALERIEQLTVAMRTVADSTAHDLRGPLNRLRAALEYALVRDDDAVHLRAAVERALGELERVEMTLEALLRIALAEAGAASLAPVDLTALLADVAELYRPLAEQKGQQLDARLEPGIVVTGNGQLLAQALANLIDNAIKYTPRDGRIEVYAAAEPGAVRVTVSDTGPGIAAEDRARALERSRRLANASETPGSGLGLALVAAVIRLHGGSLEFEDAAPGLRVRLALRRP
jgi:signal transduction histidine kinase